ncbi:MAG TPA: exodeoxyribonuclease V subunit alpha [Kofleriaceae bacterium]|nr:exodeoxyribonuclease V subunit alpha [Kofleriaceae bacterium]
MTWTDERLMSAMVRAARGSDLDDNDAFLAAELASWPDALDDEMRRALALLTLYVLAAHRRGSTRAPLSGDGAGFLAQEVAALAGAAGWKIATETLCQRMRKLAMRRERGWPIGDPGDSTPLCATGDFIAIHRMVACENRIVGALAERLRSPRDADASARVADAIAEVLARPAGVTLSDEQLAAARGACENGLAIIAGGPGTGKTAIAAAIVRILVRCGVPAEAIALAAPTGKAAHRLADSLAARLSAIADPDACDSALAETPPEPRTLHRLLGYSPTSGRFRHHQDRPLPMAAILVDEASMIDAELMDALARAVAGDARLILLGDADQLPSVDAGAVFRDLLCAAERRAGAPVAFRLTQSFRMRAADPAGHHILTAAGHIQRGEAAALLDGSAAIRRDPAAIAWSGLELCESEDASTRRAVIDAYYDRHLAGPDLIKLAEARFFATGTAVTGDGAEVLAGHLSRLARSQVLAATRRVPGGAEDLSRHLRARLCGDLGRPPSATLCPGEPLLITRNDHDRGLLNGDIGVCARFGERDELCAVIVKGDAVLAYPLEALGGHIESAFAITIHKSQGSEYDHVAVILPAADMALVTRELLYTAVTRARKSALLVGSAAILAAGIERVAERFSGIADKVGAAMNAPR